MNVSFFVAKKYFFSNRKRRFIHFISNISMVAICVGSMALVIVLSVFNGLEDLNRQIFKSSNPDIQIESKTSKYFEINEVLLNKVASTKGVDYIVQTIEDNALAKSDEAQMVINLKGVDANFLKNKGLQTATVEGKMLLEKDGVPYAFVGGGVYSILNLSVQDFLHPFELWYPRNEEINVLDPESNINKLPLTASGVFVLEQQFDNIVYLSIDLVEKLTEKYGKRTSLDISIKPNVQIEIVKQNLKTILGADFSVKDRDEQNEALFRAIKIEKLFIFLALFFILGIASFNIFFVLTMLVLDKKEDINTLSSIGALKSTVRNIFIYEGCLIAGFGSLIGVGLGVLICWSQIHFGWLKMGMQNAIVDAYPVKLIWSDIVIALIGIFIITFLAAVFPAKKAIRYMN